MTAMAENENTTSNPTPKSKSKGSASVSATVSTPTGSTTNVFEMPKFDLPKFEMPTAFREFAEKGLSMAKENYEKMKSAAEEATDVLEETYNTASKGCSGYGLKVLEAARTNTNATFDGEVLCRGGRTLNRLFAPAVRYDDGAGQGARRRGAKGVH